MISLRSIAVLALASLAAGCAPPPPAGQTDVAGVPQTFYGSVIETDGALQAQDVREALAEDGRASLTFEGEVTATCAKKGCWMDVASGSDTVFVRFLDYSFFVPTEGAEGKRTVVQGRSLLRHLDCAHAEALRRGCRQEPSGNRRHHGTGTAFGVHGHRVS